MIRTATNLSATALFAAALVGAASAEESIAYQNLVTPVLSSGTTVIDQPIAYPAGTANVTAVIVTIPPGGDTGWHVHAVPLFAYVLEGAVTVDYGEKGIKVIKAGDAILEAMNWPHNGMNKGDTPLRILAVYMGAEGLTNAESVPAPK
ncbi:MAG: cupin domain-containing protein [Bauldia sp.]|nr:cupin domain-containing protein [Bauldia sp.]